MSNKYKIVEKIGHGAFGDIYKVINKKNGKFYAVKKLNSHYRRCFKELNFNKEFRHKNIIRYVDSFYDSQFLFIITELGEEDLYHKYYSYTKNLSLENIYSILKDVANAIKYLHGKNIVHGDIKLENILCCPDDQYKLCDFGLAFYSKDMTHCPYKYNDLKIPEIKNGIWGKPTDIWCFGKTIKKLLLFYAIPKRKHLTAFGSVYSQLIQLRDLCMSDKYRDRPTIDLIVNHLNAE